MTTAVANGDLSKKITVDVRGEILELKNTINTMVDQLNSFASEVTRVAREVGTEGKLGGQAEVKGVGGTWKDLTDNVNSMAGNLTAQVRNIADVTTAVARGDLTKKITVDVQGEILELKNTINTMVDQLNSFASEVTRVAREVGTEGKLGGQAQVTGVAGVWKDLTDNVNSMASNLTVAGARHRQGGDRGRQRRPEAAAPRRGEGRDRDPGRHDQRHDRHAGHLRRPGDQRGPRGGHRRQAGRPGARAGRGGHLARPHRQREPAGRQPHHPGARHRRRGHRGDEGRPHPVHRGRGAGRGGGAQGQHQRDDPQPPRHHAEEHGAGLAQDQPGQVQPDAAGPARPGGGLAADPVRARAAGLRAARRLLRGGRRGRRAGAQAARQLRLQGPARASASEFRVGEGLVGQCAVGAADAAHQPVPGDYIQISSGLGEASPRNIVVLPVLFEGEVKAVLELASFDEFDEIQLTFLEQLAESIGIVLNTIAANMRTEELLKQSQALTESLQSQQEELTETNKRLEQQTRSLQKSEELLRKQQDELQRPTRSWRRRPSCSPSQKAEVEQKNQEVEQAKVALEEKAEQLALISKYKSEFLANMSHELRTPLNSLLILSQILTENADGNLTTKQVDFAQTIHSSGSDLLDLINDILDLSKIESGTMAVDIATVPFGEVRKFVESTFRQVADLKGLEFEVDVDPALPPAIQTDTKRLQQVLKNLLSNAFKFTERGTRLAQGQRWRPAGGTRSRSCSTPPTP